MEMRSKYQKEFVKKHGVKLGLMSPFIRAAAYALTESPVVNAGRFFDLIASRRVWLDQEDSCSLSGSEKCSLVLWFQNVH